MAESFYGGRRGASVVIVKSYDSVAEMQAEFDSVECTVDYDSYVVVNTNIINLEIPENEAGIIDEIDGEYLKVQTTSRVTALTKAILSLLNGADVQGVGRMIFSREQSIYNQSQYGLWNNRNFEGIKSVIGVTISGVN